MTKASHWLIALNLLVATILVVSGDMKNGLLGLIGAGAFGLALLVSEWRRA